MSGVAARCFGHNSRQRLLQVGDQIIHVLDPG